MRDQSRRNGRQSEGGSEGGASPKSRSEARERTIWGTLWMPLTARTSARHQSRQARSRRAAFTSALHSAGELLAGKAVASQRTNWERRSRPPSLCPLPVGGIGRVRFGGSGPGFAGIKATDKRTVPRVGPLRGRYGTPPVRMGSRQHRGGEGKAFPPAPSRGRKDSWRVHKNLDRPESWNTREGST
jgi:hypothetical protein